MIQFEIPVIPLGCLFSNRKCGIEQGAVLEISLISVLHLNDELLTVFALTIYIKDGSAVGIYISHMLRVKIRHILHNLLTIKQAVEKQISKSLLGADPKIRLKPKSVSKLIYLLLPVPLSFVFKILC